MIALQSESLKRSAQIDTGTYAVFLAQVLLPLGGFFFGEYTKVRPFEEIKNHGPRYRLASQGCWRTTISGCGEK